MTLLDNSAFELIARNTRLGERATKAARLVLVHGKTHTEAADELGYGSRQAVQRAIRRLVDRAHRMDIPI